MSRSQSGGRVGLVLAMGAIALALREVDPASLSWLPFRTSCGAITGLPCVFCGTTRAMHHLLNGNFARALYFNWLAFPVALFACGVGVKLVVELVAGRGVVMGLPALRVTPRVVTTTTVTLAALWVLQVSLAVTLHKCELLNPRGWIYGLVVR